MNIMDEKLKINCGNCNKQFISTFNTKKCPHCGVAFSPEVIHNIYYEYETKLANSKLYRFGEHLEKSGDSLEKTGDFFSQLGCLIFMIPIGLFCIWILMKMF